MNLNAKIFGDISSGDTDNLIYKTIFEQVPFGIAVSYNCYPLDASENSNASINSIYEEITGRSKGEMVKLGWAKITHLEVILRWLVKVNFMFIS